MRLKNTFHSARAVQIAAGGFSLPMRDGAPTSHAFRTPEATAAVRRAPASEGFVARDAGSAHGH